MVGQGSRAGAEAPARRETRAGPVWYHLGPMSLMRPFKFLEVTRVFGNAPFAMLDVGSGNHSATLTKQWFKNVLYSGLDRSRDNGDDERDRALTDHFHEIDLTRGDFSQLPDAGYDCIMMAHVIEHLPNGDEVLRGLVPKLRPGGLLYVEFPGPRSLQLPSMRGSLNFRDDPTHVRLYSLAEVSEVLRSCGLRVHRAGTRRDARAIALLPLRALSSLRLHGYVAGSVFWDLLGFAEYVVARRAGVTPAR